VLSRCQTYLYCSSCSKHPLDKHEKDDFYIGRIDQPIFDVDGVGGFSLISRLKKTQPTIHCCPNMNGEPAGEKMNTYD
jgi:hypothetical protein